VGTPNALGLGESDDIVDKQRAVDVLYAGELKPLMIDE
jgi:hypothetical protein